MKDISVFLLTLFTVAQIDPVMSGPQMKKGMVKKDNLVAKAMKNKKNIVHDAQYHHKGTHKAKPQFNMESLRLGHEPEELLFLYLINHDFDRSYSLDGLELYKAMSHLAEEHQTPSQDQTKGERESDLILREEHVDDVLLEVDDNDDGYLSWSELRKATKKLGLFEETLGMIID